MNDRADTELTPTERRLLEEVIRPFLGATPVRAEQPFADLGADSLQQMHMFVLAEGLFGVEVSPLDLRAEPSLAALAQIVDTQLSLTGAEGPASADGRP